MTNYIKIIFNDDHEEMIIPIYNYYIHDNFIDIISSDYEKINIPLFSIRIFYLYTQND